MNLTWHPHALEDLQSIRRYISLDSPPIAKRIVLAITDTVHDQLTIFPETGRPGRVEGTRELVVPKSPFVVTYRVKGQVVDVLAVHHTSQKWPEAI